MLYLRKKKIREEGGGSEEDFGEKSGSSDIDLGGGADEDFDEDLE